jgi:hypothetical protein
MLKLVIEKNAGRRKRAEVNYKLPIPPCAIIAGKKIQIYEIISAKAQHYGQQILCAIVYIFKAVENEYTRAGGAKI